MTGDRVQQIAEGGAPTSFVGNARLEAPALKGEATCVAEAAGSI